MATPAASTLEIEFQMNQCQVKVVDDGTGFDPEELSSLSAGHYGLLGMRERVQRMGGKFVLHSRFGSGTQIVVQVPRRTSDVSDELQIKV